ncbi:MAG: ABC transporter ATP-binding protein [Balneolia bacterium]|nr:ABC transporter ATP-binding protein [Balneolia bacterium]
MIIQASGITKEYYEKETGEPLRVLRGIDLSIEEDSLISIVGSSGSGKSTLLHIIGGLDRPTAGDVLYRGTNLNSLNAEELAKFRNKNLGFVFQFHHLLPEFSALENVFMPAMIAGRPQQQIEKEAKDLLERFGLGQRASHRPSELSGGEQQRVAVARALINKPDILLADEPTGNLDEANTTSLLNLLFGLKKELGITIVMVTHDKQIAAQCDKNYQIEQGLISELTHI